MTSSLNSKICPLKIKLILFGRYKNITLKLSIEKNETQNKLLKFFLLKCTKPAGNEFFSNCS